MKAGIYILAPIGGPAGQRLLELQQKYDPKLAASAPPHVTLAGSSGLGPLPRLAVSTLRRALEPIARTTAPMTLDLGPPMRFMQTDIIVFPMDPHGPLRELHERIGQCGLPFTPTRHRYTPHCTLNYYQTLTPERRRELLAVRIEGPVRIDRIECHYTAHPQTRLMLELPLTGDSDAVAAAAAAHRASSRRPAGRARKP